MKKKAGRKRKEKRVFSIRLKVILLVISCIVITLVSCISIVLPNIRDTLKGTIKESMADIVMAYAKGIDRSIENINSSLYQLNTNGAFYYYTLSQDPNNTRAAEKLINDYLESHKDIGNIYVVDLDGTVFLSTNKDAVGNDYSGEDYFKTIVSTEKAAQSGVHNAGLGTEYIMCGVPLYSQKDELIGALAVSLPIEKLDQEVSGVKISGVRHTAVYLLDADGIVISHNSASEKIGKEIDNQTVLHAITAKTPETESAPETLEYKEKGDTVYASLYSSPVNQWTLVMAIEERDVFRPVEKIQNLTLMAGLLILLILSAAGYVFAGTVTKPIKRITGIIDKTAAFNFSEDSLLNKMCGYKDETGVMSRAIKKMRVDMGKIMEQINDTSGQLNKSAEGLNEITNEVNQYINESSATTEELSAGMEETSASTETIHQRIGELIVQTEEIGLKISQGTELTEKIIERSMQLADTTAVTSEKTTQMYYEVKEQTREALSQSRAVDKINVFTNSILEIAEQTSLLSLNASIEAARAGESGRGFAVVAGEIGKLASQSSQAVTNITGIIEEVNRAFQSAASCLDKTLEFLETVILADYKSFTAVGEQYYKDAASFNSYMERIDASMVLFGQIVNEIGTSIDAINTTVGDAAAGVGEITERNADIVNLTGKTYELSGESRNYAEDLRKVVELFQL